MIGWYIVCILDDDIQSVQHLGPLGIKLASWSWEILSHTQQAMPYEFLVHMHKVVDWPKLVGRVYPEVRWECLPFHMDDILRLKAFVSDVQWGRDLSSMNANSARIASLNIPVVTERDSDKFDLSCYHSEHADLFWSAI